MTFLTLLQSAGGTPVVVGTGALAGAGALSGTATVIARSAGVTITRARGQRRVPRVEPAVGNRHPSPLPNLPSLVLEAQGAIEQLPAELRPAMQAIFAPMVLALQEQARFNRGTYDRYQSLPSPHGATHKGGQDNIISRANPSALTPFSVGDPGDPTAGASAGPHVHDMSAFLAFLDNADTLDANGYRVLLTHAPRLAALLEAILFKLSQLAGMLEPGARNH